MESQEKEQSKQRANGERRYGERKKAEMGAEVEDSLVMTSYRLSSRGVNNGRVYSASNVARLARIFFLFSFLRLSPYFSIFAQLCAVPALELVPCIRCVVVARACVRACVRMCVRASARVRPQARLCACINQATQRPNKIYILDLNVCMHADLAVPINFPIYLLFISSALAPKWRRARKLNFRPAHSISVRFSTLEVVFI
jgi:hypothetical protein